MKPKPFLMKWITISICVYYLLFCILDFFLRQSLSPGIDTDILFHFLTIAAVLPAAIWFMINAFAKIIQIQKDIAYTKVKKVVHSALCLCIILLGAWAGFTKGILPALDFFYLQDPQTVILYDAQLSHSQDFSHFALQGQDKHKKTRSFKLETTLLMNLPLQKGQITLPGETIQLEYYPFTGFVVSLENISE